MGARYFLQYIDADGELMSITCANYYSPDDWDEEIENLKAAGVTKWRLLQEHTVYETVRSDGAWS